MTLICVKCGERVTFRENATLSGIIQHWIYELGGLCAKCWRDKQAKERLSYENDKG